MIETKLIHNLIQEQVIKSNNDFWINKLKFQSIFQVHLAIMVEPYLSRLLSGEKTIESRFSMNMVAPYKKIKEGDVVLLKKTGGAIKGLFEASKVRFFELNQNTIINIDIIKEHFNDRLVIEDDFWQEKQNSNYATLIDVNNLLIINPTNITFKNRQSWITFSDPNQMIDQISIYDYEAENDYLYNR